ncbi:hypothetical protein [Loktanella salsilacus]|uniref:hypothetical protein n=1 Tax=Loktanella salsilacus TaxID=195913 RepID=UPI0037354493
MTTIASVMICGTPKSPLGKPILSASESVWECIPDIPYDLKGLLTDDIGNSGPKYAGALQLVDPSAVDLIEKMGLHLCFRAVDKSLLPIISAVPNSAFYARIQEDLDIVGWDVCCGNGWLPASLVGDYPIDVLSGKEVGDDGQKTNELGLFATKNEALKNCAKNNDLVPEHAPFYPVAVMLPKKDVYSGSKSKNSIVIS